ncbi:hypothetical protein U91I_00936 [alpha proteobacterium U9-1i]|nr:hypothetical protein U91I_00936 [alpha proteobacterium U9-1i]
MIEREGWISVDTGPNGLLAGSYHTCIRYPDRVTIEIDAGQWQVAQTLRGDGAFECEARFENCRVASDAVREELTSTASQANKDMLDRAAEWRAAAVSLSIDGRAWRLTLKDGWWAEVARDDGRLRGLGVSERMRRLGQWRAISGMTFPHRLEDYLIQPNGDFEWRNTVHLRDIRVSETPSAWCTARFGAD